MVSNLSEPPKVLCEHRCLSPAEIRAGSLTLSEIDAWKSRSEKGASSSKLRQS